MTRMSIDLPFQDDLCFDDYKIDTLNRLVTVD